MFRDRRPKHSATSHCDIFVFVFLRYSVLADTMGPFLSIRFSVLSIRIVDPSSHPLVLDIYRLFIGSPLNAVRGSPLRMGFLAGPA